LLGFGLGFGFGFGLGQLLGWSGLGLIEARLKPSLSEAELDSPHEKSV